MSEHIDSAEEADMKNKDRVWKRVMMLNYMGEGRQEEDIRLNSKRFCGAPTVTASETGVG